MDRTPIEVSPPRADDATDTAASGTDGRTRREKPRRSCPFRLKACIPIVVLAALGGRLLGPLKPSQDPAPQPVPAPPSPHTLFFVGDVMLARNVETRMKAAGDWAYPFRQIARTLRTADMTFGNLECPVSDTGRNLHHLYSFRADPRAIEGLESAGFRVMSVANNHTDDWDRPALLDTLQRVRAAGILPVGAGADEDEAHRPALVDLGAVRIAFLAYVNIEPHDAVAAPGRPGVAWLEPDRALADIRKARCLADVVVVSLHWGVEYAPRPRPEQIELAHRMIEAGADLVVGSHPHVVQPVELYRSRWIAYSLGNFVFDQEGVAARHGLMLKVTLSRTGITEVTPVPITITPTFQATLVPVPEPRHEAIPPAGARKATRAE